MPVEKFISDYSRPTRMEIAFILFISICLFFAVICFSNGIKEIKEEIPETNTHTF